VEEEKTIKYWG